VGPRVGLDDAEKRKFFTPTGLELRPLGHPARSQSLYRLRYFFFLWLDSPILGLGRLHETFRFISVTRSRTVGRTPWTGDRLFARPLLTAPGDCDDDGEVGGMNGIGRENRSTWRKPVTTSLCPPQIPLCQTRAAAVESQRLTTSAMAWPRLRYTSSN
jgi:hypothetical protein